MFSNSSAFFWFCSTAAITRRKQKSDRKIWNAISKYFSDWNTILLLSSFCVSVRLSILLFISLCLFLKFFLSVLFVRLFVCMIVCLFVFLVNSLYFSFCLSAWWSFSYQLICLSYFFSFFSNFRCNSKFLCLFAI